MDSQDPLKISADNEIRKKQRKRTKKIIAQLQEQVEFYFGDSNLQKDRFMKQEISKHPEGYVPIPTIASFNRMKQITDDLNLVVKAMKLSSMLEVNGDETMVRRNTPVPEPQNVDKETIYVERLPPYADHDWVKGIFSKYGKVEYVSIPRFKHTGDIKGFAFVEFESAKVAQEAIEVFNKEGRIKQSSEPEKSENGFSTERSNEQHKMAKPKRKRSHSESEVDGHKTSRERTGKRKRTTSESSVDSEANELPVDVSSRDGVKRKSKEGKKSEQCGSGRIENGEERWKDGDGKDKKGKKFVRWQEGDEQTNSDKKVSEEKSRKRSHDDSTSGEESGKQKRQKMSNKSEMNSENTAEESGEDATVEGDKKHKKRKRKKKDKKENRLPHLRVISKLEWLELKKEYKTLQRGAMKNLKKHLQDKIPVNSSQAGNKPHKSTRDRADASYQKTEEKSSQDGVATVKTLSYTPGVLLKFQCQGRGMTKKELREKLSSCAPVAYLDLEEGNVEGYVRFHTAENCNLVLKEMSTANDELQLNKLTEGEEKAYWEKINTDRVNRYNSKREKKRGTEKVSKKAEVLQVQRQSHIRFEDSDGGEDT